MPPPTQLSLNMSTDSEGEPTISAGLIGSEPGVMPLPAAEPESMQPEVDFTKVDSNTLIKLCIEELDAKGWNELCQKHRLFWKTQEQSLKNQGL